MTEREKRELERDFHEMMERDKKYHDEILKLEGISKGEIRVAKRLLQERHKVVSTMWASDIPKEHIDIVIGTFEYMLDVINEMITTDYDREFEELKKKYGRN